MARFILPLLILVQLPWSSVGEPAPTLSAVCGFDHVAYSKSPDGYFLSINRQRMEDPVFICEVLESYFGSGCLSCDSQVESWRRIGEKYCNHDFTVTIDVKCNPTSGGFRALQKVRKKLLLSTNSSNLNKLSSKGQSREEEPNIKNPSASENVPLAVPGAFLLGCAFIYPCFRAKRKEASEHNVLNKQLNSMDSISSVEISSTSEKFRATPLRVPPSPSRFFPSPQLSSIGSVHLSLNQITKATQSFSRSLMLGEGRFGTVYKAVLPGGLVVAVKRAKKIFAQEQIPALQNEFSNEVELLAKIEHRNLVRLLGYNDKGNERIIITEYVPNGTLREHLDGQHGKILDFNQRLEIAIDVAHGLTYLHLYAENTIIHRDVKSSNILLTESYRAKVSHFGFARSGPTDTDQTHISTKVKGTAGYLDPEYLRTYQLTPKSDVFSFGILLIEILSGRRPVELKRGMDERITVRWAFKKYTEGNMRDILDPLLDEAVDEEVLGKTLNLAFQCAAPTRADRPDMKEVAEQLWEIRKEFGKSLRRASN